MVTDDGSRVTDDGLKITEEGSSSILSTVSTPLSSNGSISSCLCVDTGSVKKMTQ